MREHERDRHLNPIEDLYAARRVDQQTFSDMWNRLPSAPILVHTTQVPNEPVQGMFVVDPAIRAFCFYLGTEWICLQENPLSHAIKVYTDTQANRIKDGAFRFAIDPLLDQTVLTYAMTFNGTVGSGPTTVQMSKGGGTIDLFTTKAIINGFQNTSLSGTMPIINTSGPATAPVNLMTLGDMVWVDVDAVGTGSKGLGIYLYFERFEAPTT